MTKHRSEIEVIARGVYVRDGQLLLCHTKGARNTYLPGGHVEFGERAADSLRREIREEMGVAARIGAFLGAVEHTYPKKGEPQCEVNLIFAFEAARLRPDRPAGSCEDYIEFCWVPLDRLAASRLEPRPLRRLIPAWVAAGTGAGERWASTFGRRA